MAVVAGASPSLYAPCFGFTCILLWPVLLNAGFVMGAREHFSRSASSFPKIFNNPPRSHSSERSLLRIKRSSLGTFAIFIGVKIVP